MCLIFCSACVSFVSFGVLFFELPYFYFSLFVFFNVSIPLAQKMLAQVQRREKLQKKDKSGHQIPPKKLVVQLLSDVLWN